jgi:hypothetical protein
MTETNDSLPEGVTVKSEGSEVVLGFPYATVNKEILKMGLMLTKNEALAVGEAMIDAAQQLPEEN